MEIVLINEELFKENSPIKEDTVISKFVPYISIAQQMYIEKILGKGLCDELKEQIKTDTLTALNSGLILMIAPALSFYTVYQALPFHWAAIVNKGVTIRDSENSKGVDINEISQLRRWVKDDAEELTQNLINYLGQCKDNYPLWTPAENCGCDAYRSDAMDEGSNNNALDTGIFIPNRRYERNYR